MAKLAVDRTGPAVPTGPTGILASARRGTKAGGKRMTKSSGLTNSPMKLGKGR